MPKSFLSFALFLVALALVTVFYWQGVTSVPFHPDESTQIFMSADVEIAAHHPLGLLWRADAESDLRQRYHELDSPLTRYLIGLGRQVVGLPPLPVDWDWSKTWIENDQAGALPSPNLLLASRMAVAILFPFSVLLLFLTVRRVSNDFTAWIAALLLMSNALILLHTRRAMAESALVFTLILTLWAAVSVQKRPWLAAIPAALAFCAKQSLVAVAPLGLVVIFWQFRDRPHPSRAIRHSLLYIALYGLVIYLLNPFAWSQPIPAIQAAIRARQALSAAQTADRPGGTLETSATRLIGMVGGLYLTPPLYHEIGNYINETQLSEQTYGSFPLNNLFRSIPAGGIILVLNLFGFFMAVKHVWPSVIAQIKGRPNHQALTAPPETAQNLTVLLLASLLQTLILLLMIALPWQRYYIALVPFVCIWTAYAINNLRIEVQRSIQRSKNKTPVTTS